MRRCYPAKGTVITILAFSDLSQIDVDKIAYDSNYKHVHSDIVAVAKECQELGFITDSSNIGMSVADAIKGVAGRRNTHVYTLVSCFAVNPKISKE